MGHFGLRQIPVISPLAALTGPQRRFMDFERTTMAQVTEIQRLIEAGQSDRQIGRALHCRRLQAAAVRKGLLSLDLIADAKKQERRLPPGWALQVDWERIEKDIRDGHELKRMWGVRLNGTETAVKVAISTMPRLLRQLLHSQLQAF